MRKIILMASTLFSVLAFALPTISSAAVTADAMVNLTGSSAANKYGVASASGDFNNDGFTDLVVGTNSSTVGGSYITIMYGTGSNLSSETVSTSNSVVITGSASVADAFGTSLATGDTNGDGFDDILVGATGDTSNGSGAGAVYLLYGKSAQFTSAIVTADSANIKFTGNNNEGLGSAVAMGDLNNDGFDEMLLGGSTAQSTAGLFYVLYGTSASFTSNAAPAAAHGVFTGESSGDALASSNALAIGDIDGDGYKDIVVGAQGSDTSASGAGALYIVYGGSAEVIAGPTSISTEPKITGEAASDAAGTAVVVTPSSMDGDSYNDILVGAISSDDGVSNAGAVYMVPGGTTRYSGTTSLSATTNLEFTGVTADDLMGNSVAAADINQDGYSDAVIGDSSANSSTGTVYIMNGSASLTGASVSTGTSFTGTSASDKFGKLVAATDLNGDTFPELVVGATGFTGGVNTGAAYIGYLYIDADGDGVPGSAGLLATVDSATSSDCSDSDASLQTTQTFYADTDGDTLGDPDTASDICAATAPAGYTTDNTDTNDTIPNEGVEISGDGIDNNDNGEIDEHNTIELGGNGVHPYYGTLSPTDAAAVATNITAVTGGANGIISVTYADGSIFDYTVYTSTSSHDTNVVQYEDTGYAVVLHNKGKKVYLVNVYSGEVVDKVTIKKTGFTKVAMILKDLRSNNKTEVIVTGKTKAHVKLAVVKVNVTTGNLTLADATKVTDKKVDVTKTKATTKRIKLRSSSSKVLETFKVSKTYQLTQI